MTSKLPVVEAEAEVAVAAAAMAEGAVDFVITGRVAGTTVAAEVDFRFVVNDEVTGAGVGAGVDVAFLFVSTVASPRLLRITCSNPNTVNNLN